VSQVAPEGLKGDTVEAVLDLVWKLLDEERHRSSSIRARAVGIAGFAGLIGALTSAVSEDLLGAALAHPWRTLVLIVFVAAMVALAGTVCTVIVGVLWPREGLSLGAAEIRKYPTWEVVGSDKAMVQGRAMYGLTDTLLRQRERNDSQAKSLTWAYGLLLGGILAIVLLGITLGFRYADVIPERDSREPRDSACACVLQDRTT
jgi:MFS family permease